MKHTGKGGRLGSSCKFASSKESTGDGARDVPPRAWCLGRLSFAPDATADVKNGATCSAKGRHASAWKKSGLATKQQQNPTVCVPAARGAPARPAGRRVRDVSWRGGDGILPTRACTIVLLVWHSRQALRSGVCGTGLRAGLRCTSPSVGRCVVAGSPSCVRLLDARCLSGSCVSHYDNRLPVRSLLRTCPQKSRSPSVWPRLF